MHQKPDRCDVGFCGQPGVCRARRLLALGSTWPAVAAGEGSRLGVPPRRHRGDTSRRQTSWSRSPGVRSPPRVVAIEDCAGAPRCVGQPFTHDAGRRAYGVPLPRVWSPDLRCGAMEVGHRRTGGLGCAFRGPRAPGPKPAANATIPAVASSDRARSCQKFLHWLKHPFPSELGNRVIPVNHSGFCEPCNSLEVVSIPVLTNVAGWR